ncbi:MAG: hypothetical protein RR413_12295 [Christensenellaceae bacterium]
MIEEVFDSEGKTLSVGEAYTKLQQLNPRDPFKEKKAAGSLGGSSRWELIELLDNRWIRRW